MFLFSTDIDGTIYDGPATALKFSNYWETLRAGENPPLLAYNTGRSLEDTRNLILEANLPQPDFIIAGVGTEIFHIGMDARMEDWDLELSDRWDFDLVQKIVLETISDIELQPEECQNPFKCSWFWYDKDRDDIDRLSSSLQSAGLSAQVVYSSRRDLDILPTNANKGNAISWLADRISMPPSQIFVAGDSGNDASMFLVEGAFGIIVSNAEPSLPAAASGADLYLAETPCADGVIEGLEFRQQAMRKSKS